MVFPIWTTCTQMISNRLRKEMLTPWHNPIKCPSDIIRNMRGLLLFLLLLLFRLFPMKQLPLLEPHHQGNGTPMWWGCFLSFFLCHAPGPEKESSLHLPGSHCHTGSQCPAISCFLSHSASFPSLQHAVTWTRKTGHKEKMGSNPLQQYRIHCH